MDNKYDVIKKFFTERKRIIISHLEKQGIKDTDLKECFFILNYKYKLVYRKECYKDDNEGVIIGANKQLDYTIGNMLTDKLKSLGFVSEESLFLVESPIEYLHLINKMEDDVFNTDYDINLALEYTRKRKGGTTNTTYYIIAQAKNKDCKFKFTYCDLFKVIEDYELDLEELEQINRLISNS